MPFYEYVCDRCGRRLELRRAIADRDMGTLCPGCGQPLKRVLSGCALVGRSSASGVDRSRGGQDSCGTGGG
jgi:putative FmdB family regulatory protein